jgi:hypothetical protein
MDWKGIPAQHKHKENMARKTIERILANLDALPIKEQRVLIRYALMKASQWALDCTYNIPIATEFRRNELLRRILQSQRHGGHLNYCCLYPHSIIKGDVGNEI